MSRFHRVSTPPVAVSERQDPIASRALRPRTAAMLSTILPGAGQVYAGQSVRGGALLLVSALALGLVLAIWAADPVVILKILVRQRILMLLFVLNAVLLGLRVFAVVDAYRLAGGRIRSGGLLLSVLIAVTAAPHVVAGYYDLLTMDFLNDLFPGEHAARTVITPNEEYKLTIPVTPNRDVTAAPNP